jgi:hypothetical protein
MPRLSVRGVARDEIEAFLGRIYLDNGVAVTYLEADELLNFGWEQRTIRRRAYVDRKAAHLFQPHRYEFPWKEWPKDVPPSYAEWSKNGVQVEWTETYADIMSDFLKVAIPLVLTGADEPQRRLIATAYF